LIEFIPI